MKEIHCIVHGNVQLVLFRDFIQRSARKIGVIGYVRNLENGTVEVVAQGSDDQLTKLIERLKQGSFLSRVEQVDVSWRNPTARFDAFNIVI